MRWIVAAALGAIVCALPALAADEAPATRGPFENIHVIDFDGDIEALMLAYVKRRVEAAQEDGADCVVLRIDSPGGTVYHGKKLGDFIFELPDTLHVVAWVPKMAMSGAAFIALACDEIILSERASIGDVQPIIPGAGEGGKPQPVGEKMESPLRSWAAAYAHGNGYPVLLAQSMVSERMEVLRVRSRLDQSVHYVEGSDYRAADDDDEPVQGILKRDLQQIGGVVVRKGELLTLTGPEAQRYGFIARPFPDGLPKDEDVVLGALQAPGAKITYTKMSFSEKASKWLLAVSGILSAFVVIAVMLFMFQGPGLMTIIGGIALFLVVLINITAEQMNGFPLFLILLGVALLAAEVFVVPGFGIPGFLGIASMAAGLLFLASGSTIGDTGGIDGGLLRNFGLQFIATALVAFILLLVFSKYFPKIGPARRMILAGPATQPAGVAALEGESGGPALGARGVASSTLRPAGSAAIEGALVDVVSDGEFIEAGTPIRVIQIEGDRVMVRADTEGANA